MWQRRRWLYLLIPLLLCFAIGLAPHGGRPVMTTQVECPPNHPVVIDPGHGGIDGGTTAGGLVEKDLVLDISLRLRDELAKRRIPVVMTRATDVRFGPTRSDLTYRASVSNQCKASLFLSIHINAVGNPNQRGFMVFYGGGRASRDAAVLIDQAMREAGLHARKEPPHQNDSFVVIYESKAPALLLELGFITNPDDRQQLQEATFRARIAQVLAEATAKIYHSWIE